MFSAQHIKKNSEELVRLQARIHSTFLSRAVSEEHWSQWKDACAECHQRFDMLVFPGGGKMLLRVRENDPVALEAAVRFLAIDPYHFRSGYIKEYLWKWLLHCKLSRSARGRLEQAALGYLDRRITREFWIMCKAMAQLGRTEFWLKVSERALKADGPEAKRAYFLLVHGASVHAGALVRRAFHHDYTMRRYGERS